MARKRTRTNRAASGKRDDHKNDSYPRRECGGTREGSGEYKRGSLNDISWYSRYPNLLAAAGSFPYPYRPGMQMDFIGVTNEAIKNTYTVPGILSLSWTPSIGASSNTLDPASIVGQEVYAKVRAAYSGKLDADAPDYVVYLAALDSIFTYIGWLKRVYRAVSIYTPDNYMLPDALLYSFGFTQPAVRQSLRENKTQLWQLINELIYKSRKYRCPAVMDLFNRHYWMSDNVYVDSASPRAQMYVFNLIGVYKVTLNPIEGSTDTAQGLTPTPIPVTLATGKNMAETLYAFGESLIQALDDWDDAYTISGYLTKAYEGTGSFAVAELLQGETIEAQYVPEVLSQIENSRTVIVPGFIPTTTQLSSYMQQLTVTQNVLTNAVISNMTFGASVGADGMNAVQGGLKLKPFLSIRNPMPSVADTVIASRLHAYTSVVLKSNPADATVTITAGTEVPWLWSYVYLNASGQPTSVSMPQLVLNNFPGGTDGSGTVSSGSLFQSMSVEAFDWHPFIVAVDGGKTFIKPTLVGDIHNPTVVSVDDLRNLHKICLYSEFNAFTV